MAIADWELEYNAIGSVIRLKISLSIQRSHNASLAEYVAATYSDLAVNSVTISCFFKDHKMAPQLIRNM